MSRIDSKASLPVSNYDCIYAQFKEDAPREVFKYIDDNWNSIRSEWVIGLKSNCGSFLNFTLESINGKLKQVINREQLPRRVHLSFFKSSLPLLGQSVTTKQQLLLKKLKCTLFLKTVQKFITVNC